MARSILALLLGLFLTLASTFVLPRSAEAIYPDIMGCKAGCRVVATGWPFIYVRDYTGMSVVNVADISEAIFAGDRFDVRPFLADLAFWSLLSWLAFSAAGRRRPQKPG